MSVLAIAGRYCSPLLLALAVSAALPAPAAADTLLIERVQRGDEVSQPSRGAAMATVRAKLGEPVRLVGPVAGNKPQHPRITGWVYPGFTVYFERERVLYSVLNRSAPEEIGPAPLRR